MGRSRCSSPAAGTRKPPMACVPRGLAGPESHDLSSMGDPMKALQFAAAAALLAGVSVAVAAEIGTKDEAVAPVKKGVGFGKGQGAQKAFPEISHKSGRFHPLDPYVGVYRPGGNG